MYLLCIIVLVRCFVLFFNLVKKQTNKKNFSLIAINWNGQWKNMIFDNC